MKSLGPMRPLGSKRSLGLMGPLGPMAPMDAIKLLSSGSNNTSIFKRTSFDDLYGSMGLQGSKSPPGLIELYDQ